MFRWKNVASLLRAGNKHFTALDAELLLGHVLGMSREQLIAHPETPAGFLQRLKYFHLIRRRARGIPLAYLTGHKEFFGLDFLVNKHVLVPRPETELIVELVLDKVKSQKHVPSRVEGSKVKSPLVLIDVGTGSGCVPIAIMNTQKAQKTQKTIVIDISRGALQMAKRNAKKHGVDIIFLRGNLLEPIVKQIPDSRFLIPDSIVITANLPYLTAGQYATEPSIQHEPRSALVAKNGGLAIYEDLLKQIHKLLMAYSLRLTAFLEIDPSQSSRIIQLIHQYLPNASAVIKKDLAGRERVAVVTVK